MKKNIIVLGPNGMLGQMVTKYFADRAFSVVPFAERFTQNNHIEFVEKINEFNDAVVINCIGRIKQKTDDISDLVWVNAILPLELCRLLKAGHTLVQASTDCVFNGNMGSPYPVEHPVDAEDKYGWSKILGEFILSRRPNSIISRVSIIGPDNNSTKGLLSWFLSRPAQSELKGYTNHYWNGITTLEWCKQIEIILTTLDETSTILCQLGTREHYNKYEMLLLFQEIFETRFQILPYETEAIVDRRLKPQIFSKPLSKQLSELKQFMSTFSF